MSKRPQVTPAMEQFLRFKAEHPDSILLFRMGDFYETFNEDAVEVSKLLGLTLTSRNNGRSDKIPMAGVPHHALDTYLSRLIRLGKRVAICEQMEAPQKGKAVVRREVVQVVSPGTALSDNLLEQNQNNFLVGLCVEGGQVGLATADLSTGLFRVAERDEGALWDTLESMAPAEILAPRSWVESNETECAQRLPGSAVANLEDWYFGHAYAMDLLLEHFEVASLRGFGCDDLTVGARAAGGVLSYLRVNQQGAISHITGLSRERSGDTMEMDLSTQRNLELVASLQEGQMEGTLISVMDQTCCALGGRLLRRWLTAPLLDRPSIEERLDAVKELVDNAGIRDNVRSVIRGVGDLERSMSRVCCGRALPRDLVGIKGSLEAASHLREVLAEGKSRLLARGRDEELPDVDELVGLVDKTLNPEPPATLAEGGIIRTGYCAELDELREIASGGRSWVAELQAKERDRTGVNSLKVGYNKAFGYYIEVTKANVQRMPESYIRKQTLVNAERYITPELKDWEAKILGADERARELERDLFLQLRESVAKWVTPVQQIARTVATVDVLGSFAEVAVTNDYSRPVIDDGREIRIEEGRHPVVEKLIPSGMFVPNDTVVDGDSDQLLIITGPNMAGKSTILRQVGLIALLAQAGSFVPARSARIGIVDRIFTRVGASDNLARGESTFLVEMNEAANILNNATDRSLVLLDEIGRGTSTFDGLSIAWAMTEYLHNEATARPRTLFATHYHELTEFEVLLEGVKNYSVAVRKEGEGIVFLHRLIPGSCGHSYGIEVAQLAGMPRDLIARAREVLAQLEEIDLTHGKRDTRRGAGHAEQIPLFQEPSPPEDPIVTELKTMNIGHTTPLEALSRLDAWKKQLESRGESGG